MSLKLRMQGRGSDLKRPVEVVKRLFMDAFVSSEL
jgi:hypothetical protein